MNMPFFTIETQQNLARTGTIHTAHGDIKTPAFVGAATRAAVKTLSTKILDEIGVQAVLANSYHLVLSPGSELIDQAGKLSKFMAYPRPTFTDSGGFQIFSLPDVKVNEEGAIFKSHINGDKVVMTPEASMTFQWQIGADIHMAFDHLAKSDSHADMQSAMLRTHRWLDRCIMQHQVLKQAALKNQNSPQYLYGVVQGGNFLDLREAAARHLATLNLDGYGIGGVFTAHHLDKILQTVNHILPEQRPRHLLGMGQEPRDLFIGVENGIDTFDCVAPTRMARNGTLYTHHGRLNIHNAKNRRDFTPIDSSCDCETCRNYSKAYLHHLFKVNEINAKMLASIHNERFVIRLVDQIRTSLEAGDFQAFKHDFMLNYYHE